MKSNKINLKEILNSVETLIITGEDFNYIFKDKQTGEEFINLYNMYSKGNFKFDIIEDFLLDNEEYINKENLILILARNTKIQIETVTEMIKKMKVVENSNSEEFKDKIIADNIIKNKKTVLEKSLRNISSKWKGIDSLLTFYKYNEERKEYFIDVADSREIIDGKHVSANKNKKRFKEINDAFVEENNETNSIGIEYILQVLNLDDFKQAFPNTSFYNNIIRLIYNRKIADLKGISSEEAEIFFQKNKKESVKLIENMKYDNYAPYMKQVLEEQIKYVDLDKLLLIAACRFEHGLEKIKEEENTHGYEEIIKVIAENIEDKEKSIICNLEYETQENQVVEVETEWSYKKLKKFLERFTNDKYISKEKIKEYRESIDSKTKNFYDLPIEYIDIIYSSKEIEERIKLSEENFMFAIEKLNWNSAQIVENIQKFGKTSVEFVNKLIALEKVSSLDVINLYFEGTLNLEEINKMAAVLDLSDIINSNNLNEEYKKFIQSNDTKNASKYYERYLSLYKSMYVDGKNKEEKEALSEEIIELIIENNKNDNKKIYLETLENYLKNRIITLNSVIHWGEMLLDLNKEQIITILYKESLINVKDIQELIVNKELDFEIFSRIALSGQINKKTIVQIACEGLLSEKDITKLYKQGMLSDKIINQLAQKNIISTKRAKRLLDKVSEKELQEAEWILGGNFEKVNSEKNLHENIYYENNNENYEKTSRFIIDPNQRERLFALMGAYKKSNNINVNEENPFYNYDFYVIPDEDGIKGNNSIVIAERIYEDKTIQDKFAVDNATYFFYYKDIPLVIRGAYKNKEKALEHMESQKIIKHRVNHFILDEQRNGHWALGILFKAALMMSDDDEIFNKDKNTQKNEALKILLEKYSDDELREIFEQQEKIDNTDECICEILEYSESELSHNEDDEILL